MTKVLAPSLVFSDSTLVGVLGDSSPLPQGGSLGFSPLGLCWHGWGWTTGSSHLPWYLAGVDSYGVNLWYLASGLLLSSSSGEREQALVAFCWDFFVFIYTCCCLQVASFFSSKVLGIGSNRKPRGMTARSFLPHGAAFFSPSFRAFLCLFYLNWAEIFVVPTRRNRDSMFILSSPKRKS